MNKKIPPFQKATGGEINFKKNVRSNFNIRLGLLPFVLFFIFSLLIIRLFQLTIVKGPYYYFLAEGNRIREIDIPAPRGTILDRKAFTIVYSEKKEDGSQRRVYNEPEAFAHLVGFRQLASKDDLKNDHCTPLLKLNEKIGKEGIEKVYECALRGRRGKKLIEVNSNGKFKKTITLIPAVDGENIKLSVDMELQKKAFSLIKEKKSAVVASKPQTGEILILTSNPSFNPQVFEDDNTLASQNYLKDKDKPIFNRSLKGLYPPGSIFKLAVATGALEEKVIDEKFEIEDTGQIQAGPLTFGNWYFKKYGKTDGAVNLVKGLKRSNDIFFYRIGARLGFEGIKKWAQKLGYGHSTGILLGDEDGLVPSAFWKEDRLKEDWYLGDTYNLSIGQGYLLTTPLQVNMATAVFANGGKLCKPKLLKDEKPDCKNLNISKKNLELVRQGMRQACSAGGTGWPFFEFKIKNEQIKVGCKTGTAEAQKTDALPHAWFTVFAPFDKPEIVLTVLVENSGEGSEIAAPIAKEILKAYFERNE